MPTPLLDALTALAGKQNLRLHMPGHKGGAIPGLPPNAAWVDYTELPDTGDLYRGEGPIAEAERLWADAAGAKDCFFLTGGGTQGVMAALTVCMFASVGAAICRPHDIVCSAKNGRRIAAPTTQPPCVILDRRSHISAHRAAALFGARTVPLDAAEPMGPVTVSDLGRVLSECSEKPTAVCITSPTYYGALSDISSLAALCDRHGIPLVADAAHGTHLLFTDRHPAEGAALTICSAHKTLPALGQSALLFSNGLYDPARVRAATALFGSTSPSYLLMASLDAAREYMQNDGRATLAETAAAVTELRGQMPGLPPHIPADPLRLTIDAAAYGMTGRELADLLVQDHSIACEASAGRYVIFLFSPVDGPDAAVRLGAAMTGLGAAAEAPPHTETQAPGTACLWTEKKPADILAFLSGMGYTVLDSSPGRITKGGNDP